MKQWCISLVLALVPCTLQAQITTTHGKLKLIHAKATHTPERVKVKILEPVQNQVMEGPDVTVKFEVENWPLERNGKHLHFILDNNPFAAHFSRDAFVFRNVKPGAHAVRVFPVYPWHESVKRQDAIAIVQFYVREKSGNLPLDLSKPMLVFSAPVGVHDSNETHAGQPHPGILIDWFLHNVSMGSRTGYFVRISVDGEALMSMKEWRPHFIQGLPQGEHSIKLELLKDGVPMKENWNVTERKIIVR